MYDLKEAVEVPVLGPGLHGPGGHPEDSPQPDIGPDQIGRADEGKGRLAERRTVRNKAWLHQYNSFLCEKVENYIKFLLWWFIFSSFIDGSQLV